MPMHHEFHMALAKARKEGDVVWRLRSWHLPPNSTDNDARMRVDLMREAANEIERLRHLLNV